MTDSGPTGAGSEPGAGVLAAVLFVAGCATGPLMAGSSEGLPTGRSTAQAAADATRQSGEDTVLYATNRSRTRRGGDTGRDDAVSEDADVEKTSDADAGRADAPTPDVDAGGDASRPADGGTDAAN